MRIVATERALAKRAAHYLTFLNYPPAIRPHLRTTDMPEGLNNQIQSLRRNAGNHIHSQREALIKLKLLTDPLDTGPWSRFKTFFSLGPYLSKWPGYSSRMKTSLLPSSAAPPTSIPAEAALATFACHNARGEPASPCSQH
jgi:hypothetical protein